MSICLKMYSLALRVLLTYFLFFFFNDTATTEIYTLSLHDALPISGNEHVWHLYVVRVPGRDRRSEEHTSELQSPVQLVCRLLLEKKKTKKIRQPRHKTYRTTPCKNANTKKA